MNTEQNTKQFGTQKEHKKKKGLTVNFVDSLKPQEGLDKTFWDDKALGLGVRVRNNTVRYIFKYRNKNGVQKKLTIGDTWSIKLDDARNKVAEYRQMLLRDEDPTEEKNKAKKDINISDLCDLYMREGTSHKKASTLKIDEGRIQHHIKPLIGKIIVKSLNTGNVEKMVLEIAKGNVSSTKESTKLRGRSVVTGGTEAANRSLQLLSTILNFAIRREIIDKNPAKGIKKPKSTPKAGNKRLKEFLDIEEIKILGKALKTVSNDREINGKKKFAENPKAIDAIKLLLLTGCRKDEVLSLTWNSVDFTNQCFRFEDTKTGKQTRPFGKGALNLLKKIKDKQEEITKWVFPAERGDGHFVGLPKILQKVWEELDNEELKSFHICLHRLRHTFSSVANNTFNIDELVIAGIVGHSKRGVTSRYTHIPDKNLINAADDVSLCISNALSNTEED